MSQSDKADKRPYERFAYKDSLPSRTKTSFADEADINVIVGRFLRTGQLPTSPVPPSFLDTTAIPRGSEALMAIRNAQLAFEGLPLALRREIGHDPRQLEDWLRDPNNRDRARQYGLLAEAVPDPTPPPTKAGSVTPAPGGGDGPGSGGPGAGAPVV